MENLILSINVVLPLFLTMSIGYLIKKINMFDETTLKTMNGITFKIFLPTLLFYNIYNTDLETMFNPKLMIFTTISVIIIFTSLCFIIPLIERDIQKQPVLIQAIFRSNFVIFGIPVTIALFGESSTGVASMLIAVIVPLFNILSVLVFEIFRGSKINFKNIIKGVISNPLIIASAIGFLFLLLKVILPVPIEKTVSDISKIATPLALILLGGSFKFSAIKDSFKQLMIAVFGRLIIVPGIFIPIAILLGFRDVELTCFLVALASPTAVSSFTMAEQMGADSELAGQIVVFTSGASVISVFLWIFILKELLFI
ncbi:MAG: AEC family transporter [Romboutsia sp.]|uniref:AEC family transporter n=1 Tax=Romboutsia sp. TaxID=1965302 RepID=UPI003F37CD20